GVFKSMKPYPDYYTHIALQKRINLLMMLVKADAQTNMLKGFNHKRVSTRRLDWFREYCV
ncbi:hypothetical protein, partial [Klebsiella pneumoniae]